ncbi:MAG: TPR repeat protein [Gammaproteobacteria bacterium]|jgi:TPR repeat protein
MRAGRETMNEALKWYRLVAEQGDADAQYNLGQGVLQHYVAA